MKTREAKLFLLLLGFLGGSLFGTILNCLRGFFIWDGVIIACLIVIGEIISSITYRTYDFEYVKAGREHGPSFWRMRGVRLFFFSCFVKQKQLRETQNSPTSRYTKNFAKKLAKHAFDTQQFTRGEKEKRSLAAFLKIGVMIGFFVDAFKVGS